jgi:hypothetical protein
VASIALNPNPPAALGATVTFTVTGIPKNVQNPRVEVLATRAGSDAVIYGEAGSVAQATGDPNNVTNVGGFLLGGGSSIWLTEGGPATCVANLFEFTKVKGRQTQSILATTSFPAAG